MELKPYLVRSVLTLGSVRIEENCRTSSWCQRIGELIMTGKKTQQRITLLFGGQHEGDQ